MKTGNLNHELEMIRNEQTDSERYKKSIAYYLLGITLGADDHDVAAGIQEKLLEKMRWEKAVQFLRLNSGLENREQIDKAIDLFATRAATGVLSPLIPYYIPVIVMMKTTPVDAIKKLAEDVRESLQQKGCSSYEIGYYLIYDEKVEKNNLEQIVSVLQEENTSCHIGIFSKNMEEAYAHVIRAMAMDLFLKLYGERRPYKVYTLGYWKYDVAKQRMAAYLEKLLQKQKEQQECNLKEQLKKHMENLVFPNTSEQIKEWIRQFLTMPFRINELEKEKDITYRKLQTVMYGTVTAFRDFLNDNFAIENGKRTAFDILNQQKCSLWNMEHRMKDACDELITEEYTKTVENFRSNSLEARVTLERDFFGFGKNIRFELLVQRLRQDIWEKEANCFVAEQRKAVVEEMKTYLGSDEFQRYKENIEGKRAGEESQIKLIYREVSLDENNLERGSDDENMQNFSDILNWNETVLESSCLDQVEKILFPKIKTTVENEMSEKRLQLIGEFQQQSERLHRIAGSQIYYAAQIPYECGGRNQRIIYEARQEQKMSKEEPGVKAVWWEPQGCFELVDYREIKGDGC